MKKLGKIIAFIPVRGGSKSIPLKNIKEINGRPLIYWVLDAVCNCYMIDKVVVSTDNEQIRNVVKNYSSDKIMICERSADVSTDTASTESVMLEFAEKFDFEHIVLIQATSPLLEELDILKGINIIRENGKDSVLSVVNQKRFIWKKDNDSYKSQNYDFLNRPLRQEFEGYFVENGAFYITSRERLLLSRNRLSGKIGVVQMSEDTYFEIDEPTDWTIVENLLNKKRKNASFNFNSIKCLITDCDGVLTDGGMYYSENGDELKKFNTKDGMGISLLQNFGIITGIITGENSKLVERRSEKLKLDFIYKGVSNKLEVVNDICEKYKITYSDILYIGDDLNDLEVMKKVGFCCSVANASMEILAVADYISCKNGGDGAVREICELIIKNRV